MATPATPKKYVNNSENNCVLCFKEFEKEKKQKCKRRDLSSENSKYIKAQIVNLIPHINLEDKKSFLCLECMNKLNKYDRAKQRLEAAENDHKAQKENVLGLYRQQDNRRQKRVLLTPHRTGKVLKQSKLENVGSPSKIPILSQFNNENISYSKVLPREYNSPSKIPVRPNTEVCLFLLSHNIYNRTLVSKLTYPTYLYTVSYE